MKWKGLSLTRRPQSELGGGGAQNALAVACKLSGFDLEVAGGENKIWEIKNSLFLLCFHDCNVFWFAVGFFGGFLFFFLFCMGSFVE